MARVGAEGLSQFMPGTWPSWGKDDDGNGRVSPYDPGDAIMAQGRYDCALAKQVQGYKDSGQATGETLDLALAAYNAGPGAVQQYGGIPPYTETQNYVARIKSLISKYESVDDPPGKLPAGRQMAMPLSGNPPVTSPYGWRMHPTLGVRKLHTGIDFDDGVDGRSAGLHARVVINIRDVVPLGRRKCVGSEHVGVAVWADIVRFAGIPLSVVYGGSVHPGEVARSIGITQPDPKRTRRIEGVED